MGALNRLFALAIGLLGVLIIGYWCLNSPDISSMVPDSSSYLEFQPFRGAGYPLFLDAVRLFDNDLSSIQYWQLGLLIISLGMLAYSFATFSGSAFVAFAIMIGAGLHPQYIRYCFTVLSEPLFFASLNILIALQMRQNFDTKRYWFCTGALLAWLILIKGVAWALVCVPVVVLINQLLSRDSDICKPIFKHLVVLLIGFTLITSAGMVYRFAHHGTVKAEPFLGNQLIGKMSLTEVNPAETSFPKSVELWQQEMAPVIQAKNKGFSDDWDEQFLFSLNYYDYLRFVGAEDMLAVSGSKLGRLEFQSQLASELLLIAPDAYFKDVAINFYALWTQGQLQTRAFAKQYNAQLDNLPTAPSNTLPPYYLNETGQIAAYVIKPFLTLTFFINALCLLYGLGFWLRKNAIPKPVMPLFITCLTIQAYYLLVALLQAALVRYMIPMWPLLLISALLSTSILLKNARWGAKH
ncbi:MAG: hypothetical protein HOM55_06745 [Proteobacteria bacterium]|nr:hypothetical protein [Pseudomonadota bacterium]